MLQTQLATGEVTFSINPEAPPTQEVNRVTCCHEKGLQELCPPVIKCFTETSYMFHLSLSAAVYLYESFDGVKVTLVRLMLGQKLTVRRQRNVIQSFFVCVLFENSFVFMINKHFC